MTPTASVFDRAWASACSLVPCSVVDVDRFLQRHYLRKRPAIVLLSLCVMRSGVPVGCVVYSAPPREAEKRYGGKTWELARLYLIDEMPRNSETWAIAQSIRYIRRHHPEVRVLLSYADPSAGHAGTIYKAGNWESDGRTDEERKTARCDYVDASTGKKYGRKGNMPAGASVTRIPRVSKWRFIFRLPASKPKRAGLRSPAALQLPADLFQ